jgi:hypothetical protein
MPYKQLSRIKPISFLLPLGWLDTIFFKPSAGWMGTQNPQASQPAIKLARLLTSLVGSSVCPTGWIEPRERLSCSTKTLRSERMKTQKQLSEWVDARARQKLIWHWSRCEYEASIVAPERTRNIRYKPIQSVKNRLELPQKFSATVHARQHSRNQVAVRRTDVLFVFS